MEYPPQQRLLPRVIAGCRQCPRLATYLKSLAQTKPEWWNRPVPGFGDPDAPLLILGLAPGKGGANRTGRPFTGDAAGVWLFRGLHEAGLCSRAEVSSVDDGARLRGVYITNVVKCVPPANKPETGEIERCRPLLARELTLLTRLRAVLVLGGVAHRALARVAGTKLVPFGHGAEGEVRLGRRRLSLLCSYHPSRQNTNTGRLTPGMWRTVMERAAVLVAGGG